MGNAPLAQGVGSIAFSISVYKMENLLKSALTYLNLGLPVFPVKVFLNNKVHKLPLIKDWPNAVFDNQSLEKIWLQTEPNAIGLVTGKRSGILVLDIDNGANTEGLNFPVTPVARTGSGGSHYYFKYFPARNSASKIAKNIDIRCDGGFVVVPPSFHPNGKYEWLLSLNDTPLAEIPVWLKKLLEGKTQYDTPTLAFGIPEGYRNDSAAKVIGHVLSCMHENFWVDFGLGGLREWNKRNNPPLPDNELVTIFKSIAKLEYAKRRK